MKLTPDDLVLKLDHVVLNRFKSLDISLTHNILLNFKSMVMFKLLVFLFFLLGLATALGTNQNRPNFILLIIISNLDQSEMETSLNLLVQEIGKTLFLAILNTA